MLPNKYLVFKIQYSRKTFEGENVCKFQGLWLSAKVFFTKFQGVAPTGGTSEQAPKLVFSTNS